MDDSGNSAEIIRLVYPSGVVAGSTGAERSSDRSEVTIASRTPAANGRSAPSSFHLGCQVWVQMTTWPDLRDVARRIDHAGLDSLWSWDHLIAPIAGTPDQAAGRLSQYRDSGARGFIACIPSPFDHETVVRLATEVRPRLTIAAGTPG